MSEETNKSQQPVNPKHSPEKPIIKPERPDLNERTWKGSADIEKGQRRPTMETPIPPPPKKDETK